MGDVTSLASTVFGVDIPSDSPVFLAVLGVHVPCGLVCVLSGLFAALSPKRYGRRHPRFGTVYYAALAVLCCTSAVLAVMRWSEDYYLLLLAVLSFGAATVGRRAMRRRRGDRWVVTHIVGMSTSYVAMLTAFYLDNAKNLPLWRDLPRFSFWFLPACVAAPFVVRALRRHRDLAGAPLPGRARLSR